jgi:HAD superfamily hydrolase (TIGR01509 family)
MKYDLVIFDCDGVLVDSEPLANRVEARLLSELGRPLTAGRAGSLFKGKNVGGVVKLVEDELGTQPTPEWIYDWAMATAREFVAGLAPIAGVRDVLDALSGRVATCVASQSSRARVALSLELCELHDYFGDRVYTASMVERPKPAPDLFLYAARRHSVEPRRCCVIEDSVTGVIAARAAGMNVYAYAADESIEALSAAGGQVFHAMHELVALLA